MVTPNFVFKLISIFFILFGFLNLIYQKGINKIVGIFMLFFAYVNLLSLRNKGKKQFKLALLKINICLMAFIFLIVFQNILNSKRNLSSSLKIQNLEINKNDMSVIILALIVLIIIANYISIKNYKL